MVKKRRKEVFSKKEAKMSKGEDISDIIDKLLSMDLNDVGNEDREEIIYTINEIIVDLQSIVTILDGR